MSIYHRSVAREAELPRAARFVHLIMSDCCDEEGNSYMSLQTLQDQTGYKVRQLIKIRQALRDSGLLLEVSGGGKGAGDSARYILTLTITDIEPLQQLSSTWKFNGEHDLQAHYTARVMARRERYALKKCGQNNSAENAPLLKNKGAQNFNKGAKNSDKHAGNAPNKNRQVLKRTRGRASEPQAARPPSLQDDGPDLPVFNAPLGDTNSDLMDMELASAELGVDKPAKQDSETRRQWAARWFKHIHEKAAVRLEGDRLPSSAFRLIKKRAPDLLAGKGA